VPPVLQPSAVALNCTSTPALVQMRQLVASLPPASQLNTWLVLAAPEGESAVASGGVVVLDALMATGPAHGPQPVAFWPDTYQLLEPPGIVTAGVVHAVLPSQPRAAALNTTSTPAVVQMRHEVASVPPAVQLNDWTVDAAPAGDCPVTAGGTTVPGTVNAIGPAQEAPASSVMYQLKLPGLMVISVLQLVPEAQPAVLAETVRSVPSVTQIR
jgi:hypothetical protein